MKASENYSWFILLLKSNSFTLVSLHIFDCFCHFWVTFSFKNKISHVFSHHRMHIQKSGRYLFATTVDNCIVCLLLCLWVLSGQIQQQ